MLKLSKLAFQTEAEAEAEAGAESEAEAKAKAKDEAPWWIFVGKPTVRALQNHFVVC